MTACCGPCPNAEIIPVDGEGVVDLAALERMLAASGEPALVSVMFANNETGVLQPIADVVRLARKAGALVHCDAVQAAGKVPVDLHGLGVDYLSLSAHKLGGPTGVGALVVRERRAVRVRSARRRAGIQSSRRHGERGRHRGLRRRRRRRARRARRSTHCATGSKRRCWRSRPARACSAPARRGLPNTTCISMPGVKAETQVMALDLAGVCVSAGAACSSGKVHRSAVLAAMGVEDAEAETAIRISFGWNTRIRRYRTLDRGLAGPIYPSRYSRIFAKPGQPSNFKGLA